MALLSFRGEFVPAVENGLVEIAQVELCGRCGWEVGPALPHPGSPSKRQTIRRERVDGRPVASPGETLHLYEGGRTKRARKIGEATCTRAVPIGIVLDRAGRPHLAHLERRRGWRLWVPYSVSTQRRIARLDGFQSLRGLFEFFERVNGLPFYGWRIRW